MVVAWSNWLFVVITDFAVIIMPTPSDGAVWRLSVCLSDICLSVAYIGPKSRTERPRKTKIDTEVAHVTRDLDTKLRVKRSKVKFTAMLAYQASAAVGVGTYWPWETAAMLPYVLWRKALRRLRGRRGAGHIMAAARLQLVN